MDDLATECSFDSQDTWVIGVLSLIFWHVIQGCLHNQVLADVQLTGERITCLYCIVTYQSRNSIQWNLSNWTPVYIEHLHTLNIFSCPGTLPLKINGRLPVYIEHLSTLNIKHQICSHGQHLTTLNIMHWFETFDWKWGQMRYLRLNVLLSDTFQMLNMWSF